MRSIFPKSIYAIASLVMVVLTGCTGENSLLTRLDEGEPLSLQQGMGGIIVSSFVSEDLACIAAGLLASKEMLGLGWGILAAFLGIMIGDVFLFLMGRLGGIALLRRRPFRWFIKESQILQAEDLFTQHGAKLIFSSRLLPGSRLPIYAAAGVLSYPLWKFTLFMALAGGLSVLILVPLSYQLGEVVFDYLKLYETYALPLLIGVIIVLWIGVKAFEVLATRRNRLVFLARCRKLYYRLVGKRRRS